MDDSDSISAQRSAAQYGQNSAPMNSKVGLPLAASEVPWIVCGTPVGCASPAPIVSRTDAGTVVSWVSTDFEAAVAGPDLDLWLSATTATTAATTASTTTVLRMATARRR